MKRIARLAGVLAAAILATQGCLYGGGKKRGTNIGPGWGSGEDLPPPGQPPFLTPTERL